MLEAQQHQGISLYSHSDDFRSHWIRFMLAEKMIHYHLILSDYDDEDVQDLSPYQSLPILLEQKLRLYHCVSIAEYIDERYRQHRLYADTPMQRAEQRQYLWRFESDWFPLVHTLLRHSDSLNEQQQQKARQDLSQILISLTPLFQHFSFFLSDQFSVLDCMLAPILLRLFYLNIELPMPHCKAIYLYMQKMLHRPAFIKSMTLQEQSLYKNIMKEFVK